MDHLAQTWNIYRPNQPLIERLYAMQAGEDNADGFVGALLEYGNRRGVCGDLWKHYIADWLACDQNAYAAACERQDPTPFMRRLAEAEAPALYNLFHADLSQCKAIPRAIAQSLTHATCQSVCDAPSAQIRELCAQLDAAPDPIAFLDTIQAYYKQHGVGDLGIYTAFHIQKPDPTRPLALCPIAQPDVRKFDQIVGYELQKRQVADNTLAFLAGKPANNVLLYGDGGTGKSTTVKALLGEYAPQGLRIVEIYKHQFALIGEVIRLLRTRNYKFLLYFDDLSFEEFETEYKYFKAIIDGGLERRPDNMLIYATSNRRHLIREKFSDKNDMEFTDDLHRSDTLQEKLSLAARFGLSLFYPSPTQQEYLHIVRELAARNRIDLPSDELDARALQWQMRNSGKSGRSAQQFIDSLQSV